MEETSFPKDPVWNYIVNDPLVLETNFRKTYKISQLSIAPELVSAQVDEKGERYIEFTSKNKEGTISLRWGIQQKGEPIDLRKISICEGNPFNIDYSGKWLFIKTPPIKFSYLRYHPKESRGRGITFPRYVVEFKHLEGEIFDHFRKMVKLVKEACWNHLDDSPYKERAMERTTEILNITHKSPFIDKDSPIPFDMIRDFSKSSECEIAFYPYNYQNKYIIFKTHEVKVIHLKKKMNFNLFDY